MGMDFLHLSEEGFGKKWFVSLSKNQDWTLVYDSQRYDLKDFSGIYSRLLGPNTQKDLKASGRYSFLNHFLNTAPIPVVNRPNQMGSNGSKPFQSFLIRQYGICSPDTIITSSRDFFEQWLKRWGASIFKSISGVRSIVQNTDKISDEMWKALRNSPAQFQEMLDGDNIRVHVIGNKVFPLRIRSEVVDYRYSGREGKENKFQTVILPGKIKKACVQLTAALGLHFSGIDLLLTKKGEYYCFEVNPSPGYSYFENCGGIQITEALCDYLETGITKTKNVGREKETLLDSVPLLAAS